MKKKRRRKSHIFRVTGWGKTLLFFSAVILFAALTTGRNVIFLIFSLLASFVFISSVLATVSLYRLRVERIVPQHIFSGKPFLVETRVTNEKEFFPSYSLLVCNILNRKELQGRYVLKLPAKSSVSVAHKYLIDRRGQYDFHGIKITTTYPLDLFLKGYVVTDSETIIVYPRIVRLNPYLLNTLVSEIENQMNRPGLGTDLYGFRKYQHGDDSRFINWKLSAKTRQLIYTKYCQEQNLNVCVVFDNLMERIDEVSRERFESAVTFVASLCSFFLEAGYKVKLVTRNETIAYGEGNKQLYRILRHLALIEPAMRQDVSVDIHARDHLESGIGLLIYCDGEPANRRDFSHVFSAAGMEGI
jgi:uncharacterized protein (DUF58 family)